MFQWNYGWESMSHYVYGTALNVTQQPHSLGKTNYDRKLMSNESECSNISEKQQDKLQVLP